MARPSFEEILDKIAGSARSIADNGSLTAPNIDTSSIVPVARAMPSQADLIDLSNFELIGILQAYGAMPSNNELTAREAVRVGKLVGNSGRQTLVTAWDNADNSDLLAFTRRVAERYNTQLAIGDDIHDAILERIADGDDHTCDSCAELAGFEGTYDEHIAVGLPGAMSCQGLDNCRCELVRVEYV